MPIGSTWRSLRRQEREERAKQNIKSWAEAGIKMLGVDCPKCSYVNALESDSCERCSIALYDTPQQDFGMNVEQIIALIQSYVERLTKNEQSARQTYAHGRYELDRQMAYNEIRTAASQRLVLQSLLSEILSAQGPMIVFPGPLTEIPCPRATRPLLEGDHYD